MVVSASESAHPDGNEAIAGSFFPESGSRAPPFPEPAMPLAAIAAASERRVGSVSRSRRQDFPRPFGPVAERRGPSSSGELYTVVLKPFVRVHSAVAPALLSRRRVIEPIFKSDNYQISRKLLDAAALRQEAIAANIANLETPGFRRIDVSPDFAAQLKSRVAAGNFVRMADSIQPQLAEDQTARSVRPDGNTVEIERELVAMNRNAVEFEYLSDIVSSNLKQLKMAITGRVV
jgi:flagellar basal-body rod protein FlgB